MFFGMVNDILCFREVLDIFYIHFTENDGRRSMGRSHCSPGDLPGTETLHNDPEPRGQCEEMDENRSRGSRPGRVVSFMGYLPWTGWRVSLHESCTER